MKTTLVTFLCVLALAFSFTGCKVVRSPGSSGAREPVRIRTETGLNKSVLYKNTYEREGSGYANREPEPDPTELWED